MEREIMENEKRELEGYRRVLTEIPNSNLPEELKPLALKAVSYAIFELETRIRTVTRDIEDSEAWYKVHGVSRAK